MSYLDKTQFYIKLKFLRMEHKLTQAALAKILGVSRACLANYETNKRQPDPKMLANIAEYFDVSVDYLINRDDNRTSLRHTNILNRYLETDKIFKHHDDLLDLSHMSLNAKIAIIEFYEYLSYKEKCKSEII